MIESPPPPVIENSPPPVLEVAPPPVVVGGDVGYLPNAKRDGRWVGWLLALLAVAVVIGGLSPWIKREWQRREDERMLVELVNEGNAMLGRGDAEGAEKVARQALAIRSDHESARKVLASAAALRANHQRRDKEGMAALAAAERLLDEDDLARALGAMRRIKANAAGYGQAAAAQAGKRLIELEAVTATLVLPAAWPADAVVVLDGQTAEVIDGRITGLPLGEIRVVVTRPGHRAPPEMRMELRGGRPVSLPEPQWQLLPGRVFVSSTPAGAAVWLNGKDSHRNTPCEIEKVEAGRVEIVLKLPRHLDTVVTGDVPSAGRVELSGTLPEEPVFPAEGQAAGERRVINLSPSLRVPFRWCPAGEFVMGSPGSSGGSDERPACKVVLSHGFWLGETEFTQGQWQELMGRESLLKLLHGGGGSLPDEPDAPVSRLSWDDLCGVGAPDGGALGRVNRYLTEQRQGAWVADLPSEAQWEYACRAGGASGSAPATGAAGGLSTMAWFQENSGEKYHPAGAKSANSWGLLDMLGNVSEWCRDAYHENYLHRPERDPGGPPSGWKRVHRGGAYLSDAGGCREAARGKAFSQTSHAAIGFRLMLRSSAVPPVLAEPPPPPPPKAKPAPKPPLLPKLLPKPKPKPPKKK